MDTISATRLTFYKNIELVYKIANCIKTIYYIFYNSNIIVQYTLNITIKKIIIKCEKNIEKKKIK